MRSLRFVFNLLFCFFFAQRNKPYDDGAKQKVNGKFKNEVDSHKAGKHIFCCGFKTESLCPSRNCWHKEDKAAKKKNSCVYNGAGYCCGCCCKIFVFLFKGFIHKAGKCSCKNAFNKNGCYCAESIYRKKCGSISRKKHGNSENKAKPSACAYSVKRCAQNDGNKNK